MGNIQEVWLKIKGRGGDAIGEWGLFAIVFLAVLGSFGLGRLSVLEDARPAVAMLQAPVDARPRAIVLGGLLVAATTGSVYYYPWCAGAGKIAPANQVWFQSENDARKAGYTPAKNCKGLGTVSSQ